MLYQFVTYPVKKVSVIIFFHIFGKSIHCFQHTQNIIDVSNQVYEDWGLGRHRCAQEVLPGQQSTAEHIQVPAKDTPPCLLRIRSPARASSPDAVT